MEQHPIPSNVSSYQFKLVGDMTLKQFFQVAGGVLAGIIFHSLPLLPIIKWPLVGISVLLGIGLAFLPFEERPLERWIVAFFRAVYSPTIFNWQSGLVTAKLFQDEVIQTEDTQQDAALKDYLNKSNQVVSAPSTLDKLEGNFLKSISNLFGVTTPTTVPVVPPPETNVVDIKIPVSAPNPAVSNIVAPIMAGNNIISTSQAIFSVDAAPPSPPTYPNVVVGQVVDQDRHVIEGVIMEIRDSAGRPIRALRSNKAGHFITVTQLDNGHYEIIIDKEGYEFDSVSFEATGTLISPILVRGKRLSPLLAMPEVPVKPVYSIN